MRKMTGNHQITKLSKSRIDYMKKIKNHSSLYVCVLVLMLLEVITNSYQFDLLLSILNTIVMGIAYIGVITMVDIFLQQEKYEYIDLFGMSLLTLLFSCLMFHNAKLSINGNLDSLSMIKLVIYQIGSLIKMYIPMLIVICSENSKSQTNFSLLDKYRKPIAYIALCTIVAILLNEYRLLISIITINLIVILLINVFSKKIKTKNVSV